MTTTSRFSRNVDGILLLDKPLGLSSNAALQQVRVLFGAAKAGHAGSLDPLASGLLPLCFGQATKVCGRLLGAGKTYRVRVELGARTESGDCETEIVERASVPSLTASAVDDVLASFLGEQQQIPPMHSALKFEGKRLYELARRGESVERPARTIFIHRIARVSFAGPQLANQQLANQQLEFDVRCSKGTYIRTLAADVANRLGTLGYVKALRRLAIDPFEGMPMHTLEHVATQGAPARDRLLLSADSAFADLAEAELDAAAVAGLLQGRTVPVKNSPGSGELRAYDSERRFLGLVRGEADGRVRPVRLFVDVGAAP